MANPYIPSADRVTTGIDSTLPRVSRSTHVKSMADMLRNIARRDNEVLDFVYGAQVRKAAMTETSGLAGGYIVPTDYSAKIMEVIAEESFIYPRATVVPMTTAKLTLPKIDQETAQAAGTSPFFGGIKFTWGFNQAPAETEPTFRALNMTAWDLVGYAVASNQFIMDAGPAADSYLFKLFGRAAAWYAEFAFLSGTGTAQSMPLGIVNAPGTITVTRNVANQIQNVDLAKMASKMLPFSWGHSIWACSPSTLAQIIQTTNYFINQPPASGEHFGACGYLLTRPLFVTEKLAALGSSGDLILFDPRMYVIGDRMQIAVDVSPHVNFQNYQTVFRVWLRMDGQPWVSKAITLQDGSSLVSPYVMLV